MSHKRQLVLLHECDIKSSAVSFKHKCFHTLLLIFYAKLLHVPYIYMKNALRNWYAGWTVQTERSNEDLGTKQSFPYLLFLRFRGYISAWLLYSNKRLKVKMTLKKNHDFQLHIFFKHRAHVEAQKLFEIHFLIRKKNKAKYWNKFHVAFCVNNTSNLS